MRTANLLAVGLMAGALMPGAVAAQGIEAVGLCNECQMCFNEACEESWQIGHVFQIPGDPDYWMIGDHTECKCGNCSHYHIPCEPGDVETDAVVQQFEAALFGTGDLANAAALYARRTAVDADHLRLYVLECGRPVATYRLTKEQAATVERVMLSVVPE